MADGVVIRKGVQEPGSLYRVAGSLKYEATTSGQSIFSPLGNEVTRGWAYPLFSHYTLNSINLHLVVRSRHQKADSAMGWAALNSDRTGFGATPPAEMPKQSIYDYEATLP